MVSTLLHATMLLAQAVTDSPAVAAPAKGLGLSSSQELMYGYIAILVILWIIARRGRQKKKDFSAEAQKVLDEKFAKGEIDRPTYEKYRQELSMRLKKD